jgi:hypothetical protein
MVRAFMNIFLNFQDGFFAVHISVVFALVPTKSETYS